MRTSNDILQELYDATIEGRLKWVAFKDYEIFKAKTPKGIIVSRPNHITFLGPAKPSQDVDGNDIEVYEDSYSLNVGGQVRNMDLRELIRTSLLTKPIVDTIMDSIVKELNEFDAG